MLKTIILELIRTHEKKFTSTNAVEDKKETKRTYQTKKNIKVTKSESNKRDRPKMVVNNRNKISNDSTCIFSFLAKEP